VDRDRDQIADVRDRCPDEPERYNGFEDADGCPDRGSVGYYGGEDERIFATFEEQRAERDPEKLRMVLDEVVKLLAMNQNIVLLEVGGHSEATEEKGPRKQLSKRRADFVKRLLIDQGVDKTRLVSRGYGSDCPLLKDAETEVDRSLNRRISFQILKTTSGPREPTPCPE
jgi:outer membrane protein OmpA-like peptidoglycan-associated protein